MKVDSLSAAVTADESGEPLPAFVSLADQPPVGTGGYRRCHLFPGRPEWCIKTMLRPPSRVTGARRNGLLRWLRGETADENQRDYEAYTELQRISRESLWRHVPRCGGWVETDLGPGLVVEYIRGPRGRPAETLADRRERQWDDAARQAVAELEAFLLRHRLRVGDLHPTNLLFGVREEGEPERLFIVDGLGDRHWLWWRYLRFLRPLKLRRKIWRMRRRMLSHLPGGQLLWIVTWSVGG